MVDEQNPYERFKNQNLVLRDELAIDRTVLANERTFLAYLRTSLAFAVVGGTILKVPELRSLRQLGWLALVMAAGWLVFGIWRSLAMHRRIRSCRKLVDEEARRSS